MNDQYSEALSTEEANLMAYWECVEEDQPERLEELVDMPLSASTLEWLYSAPLEDAWN